jgi:hypothetical protein
MKTIQVKFVIPLFILCLSFFAVTPYFFMGKSEGGRKWYTNSNSTSDNQGQTAQNSLHIPITHDMQLHFDQMRSFYTGLSAGVLYPRWQEDTNRGFGAPTMNYYSPGIYYLTSACFWLTQNWNLALWVTHLLMMAASALAFFLYARRLLALLPALLATAFYIFAPYHIVDQYQRGAIAELLTFVWMPLVLYFIDRLFFDAPTEAVLPKEGDDSRASRFSKMAIRRHDLWNVVGLAVCYGATLWSHIPTAYQFSLTLAIILPMLAIVRKNFRGLLLSGLSLLFGACLSGAYLYPAVMEQHLIHSDQLNGKIIYEQTYMLIPNFIPPGASHDFIELLNRIWLINVFVLSIGTLLFLILRRSNTKFENEKARVLTWAAAGLVASFMMLSLSDDLRQIIPKLEIGVFSWRFLSVSSFVAALLFGMGVQAVGDTLAVGVVKRRLILVAPILLFGLIGFSIVQVILPMRSFQLFTPEKEHFNDIMIPANVALTPRELPQMQWAAFTKQPGKIVIEQWLPQSRKLTVNLPQDDKLIVRTFNFPGWKAAVDGKPSTIDSYPELGAMEIALNAGTHTIQLEFSDTPPRQIGNIMTLTAFVMMLALMAIVALKGRRQPTKQSQPQLESSDMEVGLTN